MKHLNYLFLFIILLFSACSTKNTYTATKPLNSYSSPITYYDMNISQELLNHYKQWSGVKYKYGGNNKKGIDCSYLVQDLYSQTFRMKMPRTTLYQSKMGFRINKSELKPGDLVFFITDKKGGRHVGIYLDHGDFMHVSSSRGVMISSLDNPYWKKNYWKSQRVLSE